MNSSQLLNQSTNQPFGGFYRRKRIWISGHTGFKGAWLAFWLTELGAEVCGASLPPPTRPSLFQLLKLKGQIDHQLLDIRDPKTVMRSIQKFRPEIVFHLAAQALVRPSYESPVETFSTNAQGTVHVLEAVRKAGSVRVVVAVTTDKVYRNEEQGRAFKEHDPLGGRDPYSASKAAAEMAIHTYRESFLRSSGVALAAARAGNVIGGGDWSKDRILPDAVRAWGQKKPLLVRNPEATRPWQHVLEPVSAYLRLAEVLFEDPALAGDYNFGPSRGEITKVRKVVALAQEAFGAGRIQWGSDKGGPHEAKTLSLDNGKAARALGVKPVWSLPKAVERTMNWYRRHLAGEKPLQLCREDLKAFLAAS